MLTKSKSSQIKKASNKFALKNIVFFMLFQMIFPVITLPFFVFYGPFHNVRNTLVGMSMNSLRHQYIAKAFLSEDTIKDILMNSFPKDPTANGAEVKTLEFGDKHSDKIEVYDIFGSDFKGKMMVVYNPKSIVVGYSSKMPVSGETTSSIAKRHGAVAAINGGGFMDKGWVGTGGTPIGFIIHNGEVVYNQTGSEDAKQDTAAFTEDGMLIVGMHAIKKLKEYKVKEGISFGPPLIVNGKPTITRGDGGWGIAPRTAIGQRKNGEVLFLTIDGRSPGSLGATLKDIQDILLEHGAVNAVNLDGGSSTTMFFNGQVINKPADRLGERAIPSVFMVVPDDEGEKHE